MRTQNRLKKQIYTFEIKGEIKLVVFDLERGGEEDVNHFFNKYQAAREFENELSAIRNGSRGEGAFRVQLRNKIGEAFVIQESNNRFYFFDQFASYKEA